MTGEQILRTESADEPTPDRPTHATLPRVRSDCPDCGSRTVNGQGLYACRACDWTGTVATPER